MHYYLVDTYSTLECEWYNEWSWDTKARAMKHWKELLAKGETVRVREVRDITSGSDWLG
jgi:hypothetical protein